MSIEKEHCFNHALREAVARCPECGRCFCRECVSEHDGKVICAYCLKRTNTGPVKRYHLSALMRAVQVAIGIIIIWSSFQLLGKVLLTIPSAFHEIRIWQDKGPDSNLHSSGSVVGSVILNAKWNER